MTATYNRSEIMSFCDLTDDQRTEIAKGLDAEEVEQLQDDSFVICGTEVLRLSNFMRIDSKIWTGVYGMGYFSSYFIKVSKCGSGCVVGYRYF